MSLKKANILHLIILLLVLIFIVNIENYYFFFNFLIEIIRSDESYLGNNSIFTLQFVELVISLAMLIIALCILFLFGKKISLYRKRITLNSFMVIIFTLIFLFAPLLVNTNPNFQKDISVRKMKGPFSKSTFVKLNIEDENSSSADNLYNKLSRKVFDNNIQYFTEIAMIGDTVVLSKGFQKVKYALQYIENDESHVSVHSDFHLFGTDHLGRDIYTLLIYAIRISVFVAIASALIASIIGISLGAISGQYGGIIDIVISRISDVFLSIPPIFLILLIIALFGSSIISVVVVLGLTGWISLFRIVKAEFQNIRKTDFVTSSELFGFTKFRVFIVEILPLMLSPIVVNIIFLVANVILAESILSFLGLGIGIDHVSLGRMLQIGQEHISNAWWLIAVPGVVLVIIILSFNNLGEEIKLSLNPLLKHD